MEPLKEMFSRRWYGNLAQQLSLAHKSFDAVQFIESCCKDLDSLALNQRLRRTSFVLRDHLPASFPRAVKVLQEVAPRMNSGYTSLVFPDFVGLYGHAHFALSMVALKYFTPFGSSEFAIREFLKIDFDRTLSTMIAWTGDDDQHVRRLASEGSRPMLPWSFRLKKLFADPGATKPILDALRDDPALYVRRSVANHLNDLSKIDPQYMLAVCNAWRPAGKQTAWIIRHACRTLIRKGHPATLVALDFEKDPRFSIEEFVLKPKRLRIGEQFSFGFKIVSAKKKAQKLAIDYLIHYQRQHGVNVKVFKLKEFVLPAGETATITKKHSFADLSTRKHYPGKHVFELQINGCRVLSASFVLIS